MSDSGSLPTGDVTFVFTDIEGSTALLRDLGDDYAAVLERHRELLRKQWAEFGGHELGTEGDSFLVAFGESRTALAAVEAAHVALAAEPWIDGARVRVRAGIHRGLATPRNGEYVSLTVHQAARVCGAAHGGQTLLSEVVVDDWDSRARSEADSLGRFRVRDFDGPVTILRARSAEVTRAPRLVPAEGHNLVPPPANLIGRADEIDELGSFLRPGTLTTVVGPGGVGKTRLAIETGLRNASSWPDGVWLVSLGGLSDESGLAAAVGSTLGAGPGRDGDAWDGVMSHLRPLDAMIVLDNCEHLFPEVSLRVADVLAACPTVAVLCTSRETLGLREEQVFRLQPLSTSAPPGGFSEAAQLFVDRIGPLRDEELAALEGIDDLCEALDGLPLAIELAASRGSAVSPADILAVVQADGDSLASRDPRVPERQRTLQRALAWSHGLLSDEEAQTFGSLATFSAGFTLDAAAAALDGAQGSAAQRVLSLVDRSLVVREPAAGETRFRMLRTVRTFAESTASSAERAAVEQRVVGHYLKEIGPARAVETGWPSRVGAELHNLRHLALSAGGAAEPRRQEIAWLIGKHHDVRGQYRTGASELRVLLDELDHAGPERVGMLSLLADLLLRTGAIDEAEGEANRAMALASDVGRPPWDDGGVWRTLGVIALRRGDPATARRLVSEGLAEGLSDLGAARLHALAGISWGQGGDLENAIDALTEQLRLCERSGLDSHLPGVHGNLAEAYFGRGDRAQAAEHQLECLDLAVAFGQTVSVAFSCVMAAQLAPGDRWCESALLQGAADAMLADANYVLFPPDEAARAALVSRLSAQERAEEVAALLSAGRGLGSVESISRAREELELTIEREFNEP